PRPRPARRPSAPGARGHPPAGARLHPRARRRSTRHHKLDLAPLRILVVNAGSTSLKLHLVGPDDEAERVERIEDAAGRADAVAHRIVHGGSRFREPVVVDDEVLRELEALTELAPLHNTPALRALAEARRILPDLPHVAVFDTAFHSTI